MAHESQILPIVSTGNHCEDLANLAAWSNDWQMLFNVEECKVMHMGNNNTCHEYFLNGTRLESVSEEKDLGVFISDDLKWENSAVKQ